MTLVFGFACALLVVLRGHGVAASVLPLEPQIVTPASLPLPVNHSNPQTITSPDSASILPDAFNGTSTELYANITMPEIIGKCSFPKSSFLPSYQSPAPPTLASVALVMLKIIPTRQLGGCQTTTVTAIHLEKISGLKAATKRWKSCRVERRSLFLGIGGRNMLFIHLGG